MTVVILAIALLVITGVYYALGNGTIYEFLLGKDSSAELISQSKGSLDTFSNTVFGNPILNKLLYFAFWMLIGLVVYFILYFIIRGASNTVENIEEAQYKSSRANDMLESTSFRLAVRLAFIGVWVGYCVVFLKLLLPFSVLSTRIAISDFPDPTGLLYGVLGVTVLLLSLHLHVVFLRLIALRVRLSDKGF
jgi:hypothetical protein